MKASMIVHIRDGSRESHFIRKQLFNYIYLHEFSFKKSKTLKNNLGFNSYFRTLLLVDRKNWTVALTVQLMANKLYHVSSNLSNV